MRRLVIHDEAGAAQQTISGLSPGPHRLVVWGKATGRARARAQVAGQAAETGSEVWKRMVVDFEVPAGAQTAVVRLEGAAVESGGTAVFDDVFVSRR
ncbi:MAG: hypothetical protein HY319_12640 [Armatimonadetes bacterium]|nr:hypothetical protein [Armatimonadota bacterium]